MHKSLAILAAACTLWLQAPAAAWAADTPPTGIYLTSDFPSVTLQAGETSSIGLSLHNHQTPPERLSLSVTGVPEGWTATLLGGGQPVASAMPAANDTLSLKLRLDIPQAKNASTHTLVVHAEGDQRRLSLPIDVRIADRLPPKLSIQSDLPQLTGSTKSAFDFQLKIKNDSGEDVLASLDAQAPQYYDLSFTEGYGTQQVSAVPIKAGESKDVKLHVRPPAMTPAGEHPVKVTVSAAGVSASTDLTVDITGQPQLDLSGRDGLMSASAQIHEASTVPLEIRNSGTAAAQDIALDGSAPSGWKLEFEPDRIERIEPGKTAEVQAHITPSSQSLAGDYMVKLSARSQGQSAHGDLRVSVTTSSLWGVSGAILIAIALLVLIGAVARYGRR
ncbi:COG1470 family protein [Castellaniella sp. S9]|uniref:COG1470 family protein n=1 Tax=Castellaniella sp. S9 TaxID=2993652 RepID=UPI0022B388A0|nr:NEW3 domain-containing protein [Castellaniella sp. S9]